MIRGIFCLNYECKHCYEDNCMHILEKNTVSIGKDGKCETYEPGVHIGYQQDEVLKKLNTIEVVESSCHDGCCEYVLVENLEENIEILKELGADEDDIKRMDPYGDGDVLDITLFAFESLGAEWFTPGIGFSFDKHEE